MCHNINNTRCFRDDKYYGAMDTNNGIEQGPEILFFAQEKEHDPFGIGKTPYRSDLHQHYLFENYRQMDIYRVPANIVPGYLKGRPRSLIRHCLVRKTKSNKFTGDSVHQTDVPGTFNIIKASGGKHTVTFATEAQDEMSSCTCKDWARWHIPCKHFFTIFREKPEWSYLESAYLTTDNDVLVDYFTNQGIPQESLSFFVDSNEQPSTSISDPKTTAMLMIKIHVHPYITMNVMIS